MVYYVRKNTKLFDDKTFYDYKLCANFVDSQNQVLLDHQRHFRSKFTKIRWYQNALESGVSDFHSVQIPHGAV